MPFFPDVALEAPLSLTIDALTAGQWAEAMRRAIAGSSIESGLGAKMADALEGMAQGMVRD